MAQGRVVGGLGSRDAGSAAPDLLAACEAFIHWSEAEDDEYVDELIQVTKQAKAAIAKAKGE